MWLLVNGLVVLATVALMEAVAYAVHRWIMHGRLGWGWHRSHHEETEGVFETNDLYAVVFTILSGAIITFGIAGVWPLKQVGWGLMIYGVLYFIVHDGLVHERWPFRLVPKSGYLKRLVQAHKLHHAVEGREGCVSFGFLYAPPVKELKQRLRQNGAVGRGAGRGRDDGRSGASTSEAA
jgi:beta-carotene 3-hydroxylase